MSDETPVFQALRSRREASSGAQEHSGAGRGRGEGGGRTSRPVAELDSLICIEKGGPSISSVLASSGFWLLFS